MHYRGVGSSRGGQTVALLHLSATEASYCATGSFEKNGNFGTLFLGT